MAPIYVLRDANTKEVVGVATTDQIAASSASRQWGYAGVIHIKDDGTVVPSSTPGARAVVAEETHPEHWETEREDKKAYLGDESNRNRQTGYGLRVLVTLLLILGVIGAAIGAFVWDGGNTNYKSCIAGNQLANQVAPTLTPAHCSNGDAHIGLIILIAALGALALDVLLWLAARVAQ